eukprot:CAMPEP_0202868586 /NCGR_PEP_ID=MMETSP1391-20130828/10959_1 /ASSEMBLY_ACC=CAM_ASM_000867 /TAXON_ID=1034604 /ORGANISM="Chlamydomonas leiostraca, Strain SAG 11-49" /LENGTH=350 /DNA_ID=CAMNT_0049548771 /DNA_START=120 /DNA_END=1172 /DNA_ORIENTATION=+
MADFRFGFQPGALAADQGEDNAPAPSSRPVPAHPASEVSTSQATQGPLQSPEHVVVAPGVVIVKGRIGTTRITELLPDDRIATSDLVPEVYEGGFKLWEGAVDMCRYMIQKYKLTPESLITSASEGSKQPPLQGKRVLELGCGHGIPGILAMMAGAEVHFQDFNKEVLTELTIPNVLANMARVAPSHTRPPCRFFSGDWSAVGELLTARGFGGHYDIIMTSESIYNVESQYRLIECIKQVLQPPHGVVLVAAKSYYFGVGGGIKTFIKAVQQDGIFDVAHVYKTSEDVTSAVMTAPADGSLAEEATSGGEAAQEAPAAAAAGAGSAGAAGGNVREVLELSFPLAIQPYFL